VEPFGVVMKMDRSWPRLPAKISVVGINYAPDFIGISKYTTELCEGLVERGHDVAVITAPPYYPTWKVPKGYRRGWFQERLNGVVVDRAPIYVPAKPSGLKRLLHHISFAVAAMPLALARWRRNPDIVVVIAPSLLSTLPGIVLARLSGAALWLHIQDFEVDAAFELGLLKGELVKRLALGFEKLVLAQFDRVSTISENMRALLLGKGVKGEAAVEVRNWVDVEATKMWERTATSYRIELKIPIDNLVALYSGNMAAKQGLEVLSEVALLLGDMARPITFIFCGQGPLRDELQLNCTGLSNVRFLDLQPPERLPELLATADIHLLPQRAEAADLVLPSKLTGMLASGRPVVAMAKAGTGLATEVAGCGLVVAPGDAEEMAQAITQLAEDDELRLQLGRQGRLRAEQRWDRRAVLDDFERNILEAIKQKRKSDDL
jgi:colanic acid biosynthesis glycosyl transferase WcaI